MYALGDNIEGQLGVSKATCEQPTLIENLPPIVNVACGDMHTLLVDIDGGVWSFGSSSFGETALGVDVDIMPPTRIDLDVKIVKAAAGKVHSLLLTGM